MRPINYSHAHVSLFTSLSVMETLQETFETQPWLDQFALYYHSLPIFPVFGSVHFLLTAFALRKEPGKTTSATRVPQPVYPLPCVVCREHPVRVQASRGFVCDDVHCGLLWQHLG